jgi:hypothetical protein
MASSTLCTAICTIGSILAAFVALSYASQVPYLFLATGEGKGRREFWKALLSMSFGLSLSFLAGYVSGASHDMHGP